MYFLPSASLMGCNSELLGKNGFGALTQNSLQHNLLNGAIESSSGPRPGVFKFLASYSRIK